MIDFIVPARSGSKRLPNKNIKLLKSKPLIFYTIEALLDHKLINNVIFTSDSEEYCNIVRNEFGTDVKLIHRPEVTAGDKVKVVDEIERLLKSESHLFHSEFFGMTLPTAPLRNWKTVDNLLQRWDNNKVSYFSASKYSFPIQFGFDIDQNGKWIPLIEESPMVTGKTRSQDIKPYYRPNGAIYIKNISDFLEKKILYHQALPHIISEVEAMDVDTELDFLMIEQILNNK